MELSQKELLYLEVGRCLSAWNAIETSLLTLIEYAHTRKNIFPPEVAVGYWVILSFEARLNWCDAVVRYRTSPAPYAAVAQEWDALKSLLKKKARKRAEVAHGTVFEIHDGDNQLVATGLYPFADRRVLEWSLGIGRKKSRFIDQFESISASDLRSRAEGFRQSRERIIRFAELWESEDKRLGYLGSRG